MIPKLFGSLSLTAPKRHPIKSRSYKLKGLFLENQIHTLGGTTQSSLVDYLSTNMSEQLQITQGPAHPVGSWACVLRCHLEPVEWLGEASPLSFVSLNWIFLKSLVLWKSMILKTRGLPRNAKGERGHIERRRGWQISRAALASDRGRGPWSFSITWEPDSMDQISQDLSPGDYLLPVSRTATSEDTVACHPHLGASPPLPSASLLLCLPSISFWHLKRWQWWDEYSPGR